MSDNISAHDEALAALGIVVFAKTYTADEVVALPEPQPSRERLVVENLLLDMGVTPGPSYY